MAQLNVEIEHSILETLRLMSRTTGLPVKELAEQAFLTYITMAEGRALDPDGNTVDLISFHIDLRDPAVRERVMGCDLRLNYFSSLDALLRDGLDLAKDGHVMIPMERVQAVLDSNPANSAESPKRRRGSGGILGTIISALVLAVCPVNALASCHGAAFFNGREPKVKLARTMNWQGRGGKRR